MNSIHSVFRVLGVALILLALGAFGATPASQAQIAAPAAPAASTAQNSFCGNQPLCYEANDFAATITDFRTSTQGGYKVIDVIVRFQNKLNQPLALGYLASSGTALDDRGNRYIVYGGNGFRGIGQVYGNNFDPKFSLRPGGYGDAQFELMWAPGQTVYGLTFELNLTVDEINTVEGNQHTLGGEFPLHYRGLANGVTGGAPGQATAFASQGQGTASSIPGLPPCGTTATTLAGAANSTGVQVPASANTAVSNATTAFSNLGSMFKQKPATQPAAQAASNNASAAPCTPAPTGAGQTSATTMTPGTTSTSPASGTATQSAGATAKTSTITTAPAPVAKAATTRTTTTTTTTTAKPVPVAAKTPAPQSNATVKKPVATPAAQRPAPTTTAQQPTPTNQ